MIPDTLAGQKTVGSLLRFQHVSTARDFLDRAVIGEPALVIEKMLNRDGAILEFEDLCRDGSI